MVKESARYERRDLSPRIISVFAAGLVIACLIIGIAIRVFEKDLNSFFAYRGTATWTSSPTTVAPPPRLQADPARELGELRAGEDAILQSYAWVDRRHGIIRLPIDVAMQRTAERGLPVRKSATHATPRPAP
jgi:hypothetical protein